MTEADMEYLDIILRCCEILAQGIIGAGAFWLAHQANKIALSNLELSKQQQEANANRITEYQKAKIKENYEVFTKALGFVFQEADVNNEAYGLFWNARDQARLELPSDIVAFTQNAFDIAGKANSLLRKTYRKDGTPIHSTNFDKWIDECSDLVSQLYSLQPHEVYRKYLAS